MTIKEKKKCLAVEHNLAKCSNMIESPKAQLCEDDTRAKKATRCVVKDLKNSKEIFFEEIYRVKFTKTSVERLVLIFQWWKRLLNVASTTRLLAESSMLLTLRGPCECRNPG